MFVLYIEIAVIFSIVLGSLGVTILEKIEKRKFKNIIPGKGMTREAALFEQDLNKIKQENIFQFGREQFKKLISQNLSVPVTML